MSSWADNLPPAAPEPPSDEEARILAQDGVRTHVDVVERCDAQLMQLLGCSPARVKRLRAAAAQRLAPTSARALLATAERHVASGCGPLDRALGGGARRGSLTEFVGRAGAGKTQCCFALAAACAAAGHAVVYVDTESTFRGKRLWQIAEARGAAGTATDLLRRVHVLRPGSAAELLAVLERGDVLQRAAESGARLCVLDSVAAIARGDFAGRADLVDRQKWLARAAAALKRVAVEADVAVVVSNHVMADFKADGASAEDAVTPALGLTWHHAVTTRVLLDAAPPRAGVERRARSASVVKSPAVAPAPFAYAVGAAGVVGADEGDGGDGS